MIRLLIDTATLAFPWLVLLILRKRSNRSVRLLGAILSVAAVYALQLLYVHVIDIEFSDELSAYDLNGDGAFSGEEITPAQKEAMANVVNDTARGLAPLTGVVFSVIYVSLVFGIWSLALWAVFMVRKNRA